MIWFLRLFPVGMLLWPLVVTQMLLVRTETDDDEKAGIGRLAWATLFALVTFLSVQAWIEINLDTNSVFHVVWPILIATLGNLLLWFSFGVPILRSARPEWFVSSGVISGASVRSASLKPRHLDNPVPYWVWFLGWVTFAACAAGTAWAIMEGAHPVLILGLCIWMFAGPFSARLSIMEPEPMDTEGSPELARAYASLRSYKAWGFFWMGLAGTVGFTAVGMSMVLSPQTGGLIGASLGVALGLSGGLFGTFATFRRVRVHQMLSQLSDESKKKSDQQASNHV